MNFTVLDAHGTNIHPEMASYGIGVARLMAAVVEQFHDSRGIIWPKSVSPIDLYIMDVGRDRQIKEISEKLYNSFSEKYSVFWNNRNTGYGDKIHDWELYGFPYAVIIGKKYSDNRLLEVKDRINNKSVYFSTENISMDQLLENITGYMNN